MALKSVYTPTPEWSSDGHSLIVGGEELRHLTVARVEIGETIEAFDGKGAVWRAEVEAIGRREIRARVVGTRAIAHDPHSPVLAIALVRPAAFEFAIEKAVEIGVSRIVPFAAARSNAAPPRKAERWERIVVEAAKQSKRFLLPALDSPVRFEDVLSIKAQTRVIFAEQGGGRLAAAMAGPPALAAIGPEGGWTAAELELAVARGFSPVTLDTGILRTETAAVAGLAILRYELARSVV
jgi:16S rRNA (uracil1498-N3)-methyltransferase